MLIQEYVTFDCSCTCLHSLLHFLSFHIVSIALTVGITFPRGLVLAAVALTLRRKW